MKIDLETQMKQVLEESQKLVETYYFMLLGRNVNYMDQQLFIESYKVSDINSSSFKPKVFVTLTDFKGFYVYDVNISLLSFYEDDYSDDLTDFNTFLLNNGNTDISSSLSLLYTKYKVFEKALDAKKMYEDSDVYKNIQREYDKINSPPFKMTKPFTLDDALKIVYENKNALHDLINDPKTKGLGSVLSKLLK